MKRKIKVVLKARHYNKLNRELLEDVSSFFPLDDITIIQSPIDEKLGFKKSSGRDTVLEGKLIKSTSELLDSKPSNKTVVQPDKIPEIQTNWKKRFKKWIKHVASKGVSVVASEIVKTLGKNVGDIFTNWM